MQRWIQDTTRTVRTMKALLLGAVVVPSWVVGVMAWQNYDQTFDEAKEASVKTASILREHALKVFESQEMIAEGLEERLSETIWYRDYTSNEVKAQIEKIANHYDHISAIWITDATGKVRYGSRDITGRDLNFSDRDYFKYLERSNLDRYISRPYLGRVSGKLVFSLVERIGDAPSFNGVVIVSAQPAYFQQFYSTVTTDKSYRVSLVRHDGTVLVEYPDRGKELIGRETDPTWTNLFSNRKSGVVDIPAPEEDTEYVTAFEKVGTYPVYVTYGVSRAALLTKWQGNVLTYMGFTFPLMGCLVVSVLYALRAARKEMDSAYRVRQEVAKREEAEAKIRQMQKIESIGQLTGGIAHDFNNLLQGMVFNLELMSAWYADDKKAVRSITTMKNSVERGVRLTRQLLTFARRQRLKPVVFSLKPRIHEITSMLDTALTGKVTLAVDFPEVLWPILCDLHELELAILNIAVNARDAMPEGGTVMITAENARFALDSDNLAAGDYVAIRISDTGSGMSAEVMHRVFEPFFTTKETGKGTGLGLSQVWGFVKQSNGHVEIDSEVGKGTMITIYLPRGEREEEVKPVVQATNQIIVNSGRVRKHVLLVEDEVIIGQYASEMIVEMGFSVTLVDRAQKALDVLSNGTKVDLLFTDVMMPGGMDGLELAKQVRQFHPEVPILIATGYAQASLDAVNRNFEIIAKPYTPRIVQDRIKVMITPAPVIELPAA